MSTHDSAPDKAVPPPVIGGGTKKVLYTLATVRRIGVRRAAKALNAHNTCKACGLGMGGQRGGMTNELGEFPAVCNKSIQAQSTDIQPPIPREIFEHSLADLQELSGRELEHLGRLGAPIFKAAGEQRYREVDWQWALDYAAQRFAACTPERSFFYSSGRSSNEAGFLLQLLARAYGSNNVNNCSYYCHQATSVALQPAIGTGTATVGLADLQQADCLFLIGANPASNHPRFIHQLKALRERGGEVIVINPAREPGLVRFAVPKSAKSMLSGGSWIASQYLQPRIGGDIALLKGIAKAVLALRAEDTGFIAEYTHGFDRFRADIEASDWPTIVAHSGVPREAMERAAATYAKSLRAVFAWGMGITQHRHGVENVEAIANLALLRAMVGKAGAGLLPLRGHSNIQGIGTVGVKPTLPAATAAALEEEFQFALPESAGLDTLACLQAAQQGNMDAALLMGGNLYAASPATEWTRQALENIPFKLYLTTTLNQGHVHGVEQGDALILPVCARDEEPQPTTQESMFNYLRLSDGGIRRIEQARSEIDILCELGRRLAPQVDFVPLQDRRRLRGRMAAVIPELGGLAAIDDSREEFHIAGRLLSQPQFALPAGRACFQTRPLPGPDGNRNAFPFTLTTVRSEGQFNTIVYEEQDSYRRTTHRQVIMLHPADIAGLGLTAGQRVDVRSAAGEWRGVTLAAFDLARGCALAYFPEANGLLGTDVDSRSCTPVFKSVPVAITASEVAV